MSIIGKHKKYLQGAKTLAPLPESPPGWLASLPLLLVHPLHVGALALDRAVAALGVGAFLLERAVDAAAVRAV